MKRISCQIRYSIILLMHTSWKMPASMSEMQKRIRKNMERNMRHRKKQFPCLHRFYKSTKGM